jgi:VWFA-related protein
VLDAFSSSPPGQSRGREEISKLIKRLPANEPLAVFEFTSGRRMRLLQDFTTDRALLAAAAKKISTEISPARIAYAARPMFSEAREAILAFGEMLSRYPGRKNLIWVTDGLAASSSLTPDSLASPMRFLMTLPGDAPTLDVMRRMFNPAELAMIDSQISIYPFDPSGLVGNPVFSDIDRPIPSPQAIGEIGFAQRVRAVNFHNRMQELAQRTGGIGCADRNDLAECMARDMDDGSTFYVIGYYPTNKRWNGSFRTVQVVVKRADITLRHRPGYYAGDMETLQRQTPATRTAELKRMMGPDAPVLTTVPFQAEIVPPDPAGMKQTVVRYSIDLHAVNFEHGSDGLEHASFDCAVQPYDEKGKTVMGTLSTIRPSLKLETYRGGLEHGFPFTQNLELPAGSYTLKLAVRDNHTGAMGTVNAKLTVP